MEAGTGDSGVVITEDYDYLVSEDEETELAFEYDMRQVKFVQEQSAPATTKTNVGDFIILNADIDENENLVLNGTDASSSNAGEKIIRGTTFPTHLFVENAFFGEFSNLLLLSAIAEPSPPIIECSSTLNIYFEFLQ